MPHRKMTAILLLAAALVAAACSGVQSYRSYRFETRSWELLRAIRWGDYERAAACLAREAAAPDPEMFAAVKVTDYKTGALQAAEDGRTITQAVTFRYFRTDNHLEQSTTVDMVWRYDRDQGEWLLVSGFPAFSSAP